MSSVKVSFLTPSYLQKPSPTVKPKQKVVVRVRPFNQREIDKQCQCIIQMSGPTATITRPPPTNPSSDLSGRSSVAEDPKSFTYDECYWSFRSDSSDPDHVGQEKVYNSIGKELLDHAFEGYNTCIFA